jgi:AraC family transcriptional regulator
MMLNVTGSAASIHWAVASRPEEGASGLLDRLLQAVTTATAADREQARNTLENALALLIAGRASDRAQSSPPRGGLAPWQARRVAAYIREHIATGLRAGELSTLIGLSYSHFNRAFKASFKETPTAYIMRQRVSLAQETMLKTAHTLSRVASECGLCDQAHLSRIFRRFVGSSPGLWRRQFASGSVEDAPRSNRCTSL